MNRRDFLLFGSAAVIVGCNIDVFKPAIVSGEYIDITKDTVLDRNYYGAQFIIRENCTLDLNGFTLHGKVGDNYAARAYRLENGATIKNGIVRKYATGGYAAHQLPNGYLNTLKGVSKEEAQIIGDTHRLSSSGNQTIDNIVFRDIVGEAVYIQAFVNNVTVKNCNFDDVGRMHIYCDHGSLGHNICNNYFGKCGYNHVIGREGIAMDACIDVSVHDNIFNGSMSAGCINIYTNWGENGITREKARNNNIYSNLFKNNNRGITLASRHYRSAAGKITADHAENNKVYNNQFIDFTIPVEDLGLYNEIYNNTY